MIGRNHNMKPVIVVVDGNNLAKAEFYIEDKFVPPRIDKQIVVNLTSWAEEQQIPCRIKLFLDPRKKIPASSAHVSVRVADHGTIADDYIVEHVQLCYANGDPCIVITNDGGLQSRVKDNSGQVFSVDNFI